MVATLFVMFAGWYEYHGGRPRHGWFADLVSFQVRVLLVLGALLPVPSRSSLQARRYFADARC